MISSIPNLPAPLPQPSAVAADGPSGSSFWDAVKGAMDQVTQLQSTASTQVADLVTGNAEDVHAATISVEKADLAFGLMLQLRNKAVAAYQDISHMAF